MDKYLEVVYWISYDKFTFNILKNSKYFPTYHFLFLQSCVRIPVAPITLVDVTAIFFLTCSLLITYNSTSCPVIVAILLLHLVNSLFKLFVHFQIRLFIFLYSELSFSVLKINYLARINFTNIQSQFMCCLLTIFFNIGF